MIRVFLFAALGALILTACNTRQSTYSGSGNNGYFVQAPRIGQGQYVRPEYLNATPTPRIPRVDLCRSQFYLGLVGQHEGMIYIAGLPGRKRVLKPAFLEDFDRERVRGIDPEPPLIEVRDYLPQQVLYAPSIRTITNRIELGPEDETRLTIELNEEGYIQELRCE